jgi:HAD superfamily hydrolase (TIGR01509 family)
MPRPALLSDIGNVLVSFDFGIAAQRMAERCTVQADGVLAQLETIKGPFEAGDMDDAAFVKAAMAALAFEGTSAQFEEIWCEIFAENAAMAETLAALAGTVPMLLLSNTSAMHKDYLWRTFPIFRHFQDGVYSYSARSSKPDEAIFRHAIERFDLDPACTLFIDDMAPNIATAQRLGFDVVHYQANHHTAMEAALARWRQQHGLA